MHSTPIKGSKMKHRTTTSTFSWSVVNCRIQTLQLLGSAFGALRGGCAVVGVGAELPAT